MEALLVAGQSNPSCGSVADLQGQLRNLLSSRVTETRAEHVSVTFEIRATTVFEIPVTETENEALENASNIDPLLGGARSSTAPAANGNGAPAARRINAIDALINQPSDDPVLQRSIIRHLIIALGEVDGSNGIVRQVSRGEQGWTFTYICKDSCQAWSRQVSKAPAKTVIGEWSEKGSQDPVHMARPAFDCRGSVKIAFVKSTRTIDVKYEHTPIHKTVGQLIELLAPPPIAPSVKTPAKRPKEPKPPKEPRPPKPPREPKPKTPRPSKKRAAGENGVPDGEGSQPKKRRKKKDSIAPNGPGGLLPPEMPGALPVGDPSARQLYNTQAGDSGGAQPGGSSSYPDGLVNAGEAMSNDTDVHSHSILNLSPGEAARRRDVAIKILTQGNIDSKTLSAEQFSIFANQSPELQQDSLVMLVKYGAERLRIVHPNRDGSSSGQATPAKQSTPAPAQPPSTKAKKPRKKKSDAEAAVAGAVQDSETPGGKSRRRICDQCRINKYKGKCNKALPSCSSCLAEGVACVYPTQKPRASKAADAAPEAAPQAPEPMDVELANNEPDDLGSPGFHTSPFHAPAAHEPAVDGSAQQSAHEHFGHGNEPAHEPVPEPVSHQVDSPSDTFNQGHGVYRHPSGLTFPQVAATTTAQASIPSAPMESTSMDYIPTSLSETPDTSMHSYTYPQPPAAQKATSEYTYPEQTTPAVAQDHRSSSRATQPASRRTLPSGQPSLGSGTTDTIMNAQTGNRPMSNNTTAPVTATRTSPRQARAKKPAPVSQAYDDLRQQASSWGAASQTASQATQPVRTSPALAAAQPARAKSRQSNRAQSNTPVNNMPATRQAQAQGAQSRADSSGYTPTASAQPSSSAQNYNNYNQYSTGNTQADTSSDRISYQPYSNSATPAQSSSYSSFDTYNARAANTTPTTLPAPGSQNVASSYPSTSVTPSSTTQWGSASSTPQARNSRAYTATQSAAGTTSYNLPASTQQSQSLQGFSVRPQAQTQQARSSSSMYSQQPQQQQHTQQHQAQQQQQQQQSYNGYVNQQQPHTSSTSTHQNNWYGGFGAGNTSSSGYNSAAATTGSGNNAYSAAATTSQAHGHSGHGHQTQQHRSLNLPAHSYSGMDGDQALYDLLRTNPAR